MLVFAMALGLLAGASWVQLQPELLGLHDRYWVGAAGAVFAAGAVGVGIVGATGRFGAGAVGVGIVGATWPRFSFCSQLRLIQTFIASACLMAIWTTHWAQTELQQRLPAALDQQSVWLDLTVTGLPTLHDRGWRFEVMINQAKWSVSDQENISSFPKRGVLSWYQFHGDTDSSATKFNPTLKPGQRWHLQAKVRRPAGTLNPGGFDYEAWMLEKRLYFNGSVQQGKKQPAPQIVGQDKSFSISIDQARDWIRQRIDYLVGHSPYRHILTALVVGDQRAISTADWALFQRTGVSHLMSISGLHVTMLAGLVGGMGGLAWRLLCRRPVYAGLLLPVQSVAALTATLAAFGYALLAGFAIPARRTAWMLGIVALSRVLGIRADPWAVISIAVMVVLISDPMACLAPGFWLSFFAVAVLFGLHRPENLTKSDKKFNALCQRFLANLGLAAKAQLAITFGLLPITVLYFQQVILVGPLANAIAIPVVSFLVTPLAMLGSGVALFSDTTVILNAAAVMVNWLHDFLIWCGSLSWAAMDWPSPGNLRVTASSIGVAIALGSFLPGRFRHWRHLGWLSLLLLWKTPDLPPAVGQMEIVFIDVGQGSSVLVRTHQHNFLYDTGPTMGDSDAGARMVMPVLRQFGIRRIDQLMISHFDDDHSGGLASVLAGVNVGVVTSPEPPVDEIVQMPRHHQPKFDRCQAGQKWQWDHVQFEVLFPDPQDIAALQNRKRPDRNAMSCVLRIQAQGGQSLLLAGDIPAQQEAWLAQRFDQHRLGALNDLTHDIGAGLASNVLLAPHHGSKTSSSAAFLAQVNPQVVVVQAGYRNRYGHPHPQVLDRITGQVLRTDLQGQIRLAWVGGVESGYPLGSTATLVATDFWDRHRRYWHQPR